MWDLLGLFIAFTGIFILRARRVDFYVAVTLASIIIGLTSGKPVSLITEVLYSTLWKHGTWDLAVAVALISVLGYSLKRTGLMVKFIEDLSVSLPGSTVMALIPALFGFLSIPGGALLSAPFIEPEADKLGLSPEARTYYNVWFRHLLYWVNPIAPSTILAVTLGGIDINTWIKIQSPIFVSMVVIGLVTSRSFTQSPKENHGLSRISSGGAKGVLPIIVTVVLTILGAPIWVSLSTGILLTMLLGKTRPLEGIDMLKKGVEWSLVLSMLSILYLRDMIQATGQVTRFFTAVAGSGVPVLFIAVVVSLITGLISGAHAMGVGIALPLLLPLFGNSSINLTSIVFIGVTCTYIISPLHLCLVLSKDYFKSDLLRVTRYLGISSLALYLAGSTYHLLLYIT